MPTYIDPNPPRKSRKPSSKNSPRVRTPGELLHSRAEAANEAARVPQDDKLA
ncbi:hypothetical protein NG726_25965 [Pseudomonas sp. MOB-449]|nr:hypothetical protein [Pseudomonas sp. MOB-449]